MPSVAAYVTGNSKIPSEHLDVILDVLGLNLMFGSDKPLPKAVNFLLEQGTTPDERFFESEENGRRVYRYGSTPAGQ